MSLRQLSRQTAKQPSKTLFFFLEENKTGIAPTRIIVEKDIVLSERMHITVNWGGGMQSLRSMTTSFQAILFHQIVTSFQRIVTSFQV